MGRGWSRARRAAAGLAFAGAFLWVDAASAQLPQRGHVQVVRAGFVGFGTGDDVNCPTGAGVAGGVEVRTSGRFFAGFGADLYVATPTVCTELAKVVPHESGSADELSGITLLFAPRLSSRLGTSFGFGDLRFEPSIAVGAVYAPEMWGDAERTVVPWAGGALALLPRAWRVGFLVEHGYHRVPVSHRSRNGAGMHVLDEFGRWKRVTNIGVTYRR